MLDRHPVDGVHLVHHQVDEVGIGQRDDEFVDHASAARLEDLDRQHVAFHGTDAAGHLAERARTIGQPDADDDGVHGRQGRHGM